MTENLRSDLLTRLQLDDSSADESLPLEVDQAVIHWANTGDTSKYLQQVSVKISSESAARYVASQIAASWNGALCSNTEFGYLVFAVDEFRIRQDFMRLPAQYALIESDSSDDNRRPADALASAIAAYISPLPEIRIFHFVIDGRRIGYIRLSGAERLPAYVTRGFAYRDEWELKTWHVNSANEWKPTPVSNEEAYKLFALYFQTVSSDTNEDYLLPRSTATGLSAVECTFETRIEQWLFEQQVSTLDGFLSFVTQSLLSDDESERAVVSRVYSLLADVCGPLRRRIVKLLLGFLFDEQLVARSALKSIGVLGEQDTYYFLLHNVNLVLDDPGILVGLISCLGELAPGEYGLKDIVRLSRSIQHDIGIVHELDRAVNRIFERHSIPRYEPEIRKEFERHIYTFNYSPAIAAIHGASYRSICVKRQLRAGIVELLAYGQMRIESRFHEAYSCLNKCMQLLNDPSILDVATSIDHEREELARLLSILSIEDMKTIVTHLDIERTIDAPELSDYYGRVYALIDVLTRRLGREVGVLKPNDSVDESWLLNRPAIMQKVGLHRPGFRVNRIILSDVFDALASEQGNTEEAERLKLHAAIVRMLEPIPKARRKSRGAHGTEAITLREPIPEAQKSLSRLLGLTIGATPELVSYRELNGWIRALLALADASDIALEDIIDYETA